MAREPLFTHAVIQFMRCYASFTKYSPHFYTNVLFEWLIAQCVELSAILRMMAACTGAEARVGGGPSASFAHVMVATEWILGSVAFVLAFAKGAHLKALLQDYEDGMASVSALDSEAQGAELPKVSDDAVGTTLDGLHGQVVRLDAQVDAFARNVKAAEKDGAPVRDISGSVCVCGSCC